MADMMVGIHPTHLRCAADAENPCHCWRWSSADCPPMSAIVSAGVAGIAALLGRHRQTCVCHGADSADSQRLPVH